MTSMTASWWERLIVPQKEAKAFVTRRASKDFQLSSSLAAVRFVADAACCFSMLFSSMRFQLRFGDTTSLEVGSNMGKGELPASSGYEAGVPISRNLIEISILCTHQQYNWKYAYNNTRYVIWPTHANINITIMTRHTTFTAKVLLVFFHFLLYHDTLLFVQEPFRRVELRDVLQAIPPFSRRQIPRITKVFGTSMPWIVLSR